MRSLSAGAIGVILGAVLGLFTAENLLKILITILVVGAVFYFGFWGVLEARRRREESARLRKKRLQSLVPQMEEFGV